MATDLAALIARVESATQADRELDLAILTWIGHAYIGGPPRYTGSIDAALSLVPDGCGYGIDAPPDTMPVARCQWPMVPGMKPPVHGRAATPALALCAAALRARAAMEEQR